VIERVMMRRQTVTSLGSYIIY